MLPEKGVAMEVFLAVLLVVLQLLAALFGALRAYLELKASGKEEDDHPDAQDRNHRPKHLKG